MRSTLDQIAPERASVSSLRPVEPRSRSRRQDVVELCVGYALILIVIWTPMPLQRPLYWVAVAFLLATSVRPGEDWRGLGLSGRNLLRSSFIVLPALLIAAVSVAAAEHLGALHAPHSVHGFVHRYSGYCVWSFAQQFLLQSFFLLRFRRLLPGRTPVAVFFAAGIFAAAHLPNPLLTAFTLVWGLVACAVFVRLRNLYPLAVAHAILGITVAICLPPAATHNMRVGLGYLRYTPRPVSSQADRPHGIHQRMGHG